MALSFVWNLDWRSATPGNGGGFASLQYFHRSYDTCRLEHREPGAGGTALEVGMTGPRPFPTVYAIPQPGPRKTRGLPSRVREFADSADRPVRTGRIRRIATRQSSIS